MNWKTTRVRWPKGFLPLLLLVGLALIMAACDTNQPAEEAVPASDVARPIEDQLQQAFALLPDGMATQDFAPFEQYIASPEQGADEAGINEIYTWVQALRNAGTTPADTATYKLNQLHVTNIQAKGDEATAHLSLDMSKIANGNDPDAAFAVEQDIALLHINGNWRIGGADQAQVTDQTAAPQ